MIARYDHQNSGRFTTRASPILPEEFAESRYYCETPRGISSRSIPRLFNRHKARRRASPLSLFRFILHFFFSFLVAEEVTLTSRQTPSSTRTNRNVLPGPR